MAAFLEEYGKFYNNAVKVIPMLEASFRELELVKRKINKIKASHSYEEIEESWIAILTHLVRAWNKCRSELKSNPTFKGLYGYYNDLIENDDLLNYLTQARNVADHSHVVVIRQFGNKSVTILPGYEEAGAHIIHKGNNIFEVRPVDERSKKHIVFDPRCKVLKIVNKKREEKLPREYPPPTKHLGEDIGDDLLKMASLAVKFYEGAYTHIRTKLTAKQE